MKLASLRKHRHNLQLVDSLINGGRVPIIAALLAIAVLGCSSGEPSAGLSSSIDPDGDLSNPPLDPPYLTDLTEGSDEGVAMRFGDQGATERGKDRSRVSAESQSDVQAAATNATSKSPASTSGDESSKTRLIAVRHASERSRRVLSRTPCTLQIVSNSGRSE